MTPPLIPGALVNAMCRAAGLRPDRVHHIDWDAKTNLVTFDYYLDGPEGGMYFGADGDIARGTRTASMDWTLTHLSPPDGASTMPCCGGWPLEHLNDRMTLDPTLVTCHPETP